MDLTSILPMLMGMNNKDGGMANILSMMNAMQGNKNQAPEPKQEDGYIKHDDQIKNRCKEPRFWNSPARDTCSDPVREDSQSHERPSSGQSGLSPDMMGMLASAMGGGGVSPDMMSMLTKTMGGGGNNMMSLLPMLLMNQNKQKAKTASVGLDAVKDFCPLEIRMKLNYYLCAK